MRFHLLALTLAITLVTASFARAETVVSFSPRGAPAQFYAVVNHTVTAAGAVVLLPGGNGRLDIDKLGGIARLNQNHVVRTRKLYAASGLTTMPTISTVLPDIARDFKLPGTGVVNNYRATAAFAQDIGAAVLHMRALTGKPVLVMGTSRGSLSVSNAVSKLSGAARPDGAVITSGLLSPTIPGLNVRSIVRDDPRLLAVPMLVVVNRNDKCALTPPGEIKAFAEWYAGNGRVLDTEVFTTTAVIDPDPCEARTPHGFWGQDRGVAAQLTKLMRAMIAGL